MVLTMRGSARQSWFSLCVVFGVCYQSVSAHAYMSVPEARNVPNNADRQSLAAGGPYTVLQNGVYRHGMCGNMHTDPIQNWNTPGNITATYTEGMEIDISVVVTAHHLGYFEFQLCDNANISEECFAQHPLSRVDCAISNSTSDPTCKRWWKPLAQHEVNGWTVSANGNYHWEVTGTDTTSYKARFVLPVGVTCTNCVLRFHYFTTNGCEPTNTVHNPNKLSEEFWNCADIRIVGVSHTTNTDATQEAIEALRTTAPQDLTPVGLNNYCPEIAMGERQEYAEVVQCTSPGIADCTYPVLNQTAGINDNVGN